MYRTRPKKHHTRFQRWRMEYAEISLLRWIYREIAPPSQMSAPLFIRKNSGPIKVPHSNKKYRTSFQRWRMEYAETLFAEMNISLNSTYLLSQQPLFSSKKRCPNQCTALAQKNITLDFNDGVWNTPRYLCWDEKKIVLETSERRRRGRRRTLVRREPRQRTIAKFIKRFL